MNIVKEFILNDTCSYLENLKSTTEYKMIEECSTFECQELIERGYRRFGKMFFRPICEGCNECQSIKIDVENFHFSKSKRRVFKKAKDIKIVIQKPNLSQEHLSLFKKYHLYMKDKKGWEYHETDVNNYYNSFVSNHEDFGHEILYFDEEKLIGVDLIDILEDGISSIYFYYDPEYSHLSLGKLSLLYQVNFAQQNGLSWIYLGYYVKDCSSLSYKAEYTPYVTLQKRASLQEKYIWS